MADQIRVNYEALEDMAQTCIASSKRLQENTAKMVQKAAQDMQGGTLTGDVGEAFSSALNGPLTASINKLGQKLEEVAKDIRAAISDMKSADSDVVSSF